MGLFTAIAGRPLPAFPRGTDMVAPALVHGQGEHGPLEVVVRASQYANQSAGTVLRYLQW